MEENQNNKKTNWKIVINYIKPFLLVAYTLYCSNAFVNKVTDKHFNRQANFIDIINNKNTENEKMTIDKNSMRTQTIIFSTNLAIKEKSINNDPNQSTNTPKENKINVTYNEYLNLIEESFSVSNAPVSKQLDNYLAILKKHEGKEDYVLTFILMTPYQILDENTYSPSKSEMNFDSSIASVPNTAAGNYVIPEKEDFKN